MSGLNGALRICTWHGICVQMGSYINILLWTPWDVYGFCDMVTVISVHLQVQLCPHMTTSKEHDNVFASFLTVTNANVDLVGPACCAGEGSCSEPPA